MKKLIIILGLIGCSDKRTELINEIGNDTLIIQDTMISSFANQLKGISKSIKTKNIYTHNHEDSLVKRFKKIDSKAKNLKKENDFYLEAIDGYNEIINSDGVIDAYIKAATKDTTK